MSNGAVILIVGVMTVLLLPPTLADDAVRPFGILSFLVMFGLVLRARGLQVLLRALGAIALLYAALFAFGWILVLLNG